MKKILFIFPVMVVAAALIAQQKLQPVTFKAGWNTYKAAFILHEYTYNYTYSKDTLKLAIADSTVTYYTSDSAITMSITYIGREKNPHKTANWYNPKKQLIRSEQYRGDNLQDVNEWRYDEKNRKIFHQEDNKQNGNVYKHNYDYSNEKNGDLVIHESAYFNGKIEFYTKSFYDKKDVKYKEIRLNDNNKDIIHIESYVYGDNGKVKKRTVYFPEFKVTKTFDEPEGEELPKCSRSYPMGTAEKVVLYNRIPFIKKFMQHIQPILNDKDCQDFEYTFSNGTNCEMVTRCNKSGNQKQLVFRYKERVQ